MSDRTQFAVGRHKVAMPRPMKRSLQVASAALLTAAVVLFVMMINGFLVGRGGTLAGVDVWLAFIKRSDIIGTIILTGIPLLAARQGAPLGAPLIQTNSKRRIG